MKLSSPSPFPNFPSSSSSIDAGASAARAGCQGKERGRERKGLFLPPVYFGKAAAAAGGLREITTKRGGEEGKERMLLLSPQVFPTTQEGRKRGGCGRDCPLAGDSPSIPRDFFSYVLLNTAPFARNTQFILIQSILFSRRLRKGLSNLSPLA